MSLKGKVSIITGASRGIGAGIARAFAAEGCQVVGIGRDVEVLNAVVEDIESKGGRCTSIIADVTDPNQVNNAVEQVLENFGKIDILVNNAGIALSLMRAKAMRSKVIKDGTITLVNYNALDGIRLAHIGVDWFYGR